MFNVQCLESRQRPGELFSKFCIEPLTKGQGITIGNALRRTLLSNVTGLAIIGVRISDVEHEFSTIRGVQEDVIEILLNLKQIVLKGQLKEPTIARLNFQGQGIVTTQDIEFTNSIISVDPQQYIATITSARSFEIEILIAQGQGYSLSNSSKSFLPEGFLSIDAVFLPVRKVNFFVETSKDSQAQEIERLLFEIQTNGSITPIEAFDIAASLLADVFTGLKTQQSDNRTFLFENKIPEEHSQDMREDILIEELELSVRAYNCLKRANIDTLKELLNYSQTDLLEFKNFGQKSADEVCESLTKRFNLSLNKK
jgi:DNA-directed RNA polymerase subunit alpha